jgi:carbamoyltransferase
VTAILGLNAYHGDAAAALVMDGQLVAAAEEERFSRVKHVAGFPSLAAAWCLEDAGLSAADLDHVAIGRDPRANAGRKVRQTLRHPPRLGYVASLENYGQPFTTSSTTSRTPPAPTSSRRSRKQRSFR